MMSVKDGGHQLLVIVEAAALFRSCWTKGPEVKATANHQGIPLQKKGRGQGCMIGCVHTLLAVNPFLEDQVMLSKEPNYTLHSTHFYIEKFTSHPQT